MINPATVTDCARTEHDFDHGIRPLDSESNAMNILDNRVFLCERRSFRSWCVKGTKESTSRVDFSVPLTYHDLKDLGLIFRIYASNLGFS